MAAGLLSSAIGRLFGIVIVAGAALSFAVWFAPWKILLNYPAFGLAHLRLIVASMWIVLLTALVSPVRAVYSAFQAEYRLAAPMFTGVVLCFGLAAIGIRAGFSMPVVVSAPLAANLAGLAAGLWMMPRVLGVRVIRSPAAVLPPGSLSFFLIEACTILIFQADVFLVNLLLGQAQAAVFALHFQLFLYIQTGIALMVAPYWPAFGEAWRGGEKRWLESGVRRLALATAAIAGIGVAALLAAGEPLMAWWNHGEVQWNPALGALIGVNTVIQSVTGVYATALGSLGIARDPARVVVAQALFNLGICVWLIRPVRHHGRSDGVAPKLRDRFRLLSAVEVPAVDGMSVELSVCIPTFNRAHLLEQSLEILLPQCEGRPVEVCVSNNASTDWTRTLLAKYPKVCAVTQTSNIGIDRNILTAIRLGTGKYVLPIGDDETILPGGIDRILSALSAGPDMVILNAAEEYGERAVDDCRRAFELYWDKMPLGGFAIRGEYAGPRFTERYLGTWHAYSGAAWDYLEYLAERRNIYVSAIPERVVEFRKVPKAYAAQADIIHFQAIPRWFDLLPQEYARVARRARRTHFRRCAAPRALVRFGVTWLRRHV